MKNTTLLRPTTFAIALALTIAASATAIAEEGTVKQYRVLVADRVGFEANASKITNEQSVVVDLMAGWLAENDNLTVTVEGHADSDEKDPEALSRVRAQKVLDALVAAGVPPTRLDVRPFGATKPATEGKADEERAFNRRVEFFVVKTVVEPPKFSALGESVESASPEVQWVARRS